jgi:hypothetical protein
MLARLLPVLCMSCSLAPAAPAGDVDDPALAADMAEAARRFLSALAPAQAQRAKLPFGGPERENWHYVPRTRKGIALRDLTDAQRSLAFGFLATALTRRGLLEVSAVMALEEVLRARGGGSSRDAGAYFLSVFGDPTTRTTAP